MHIPTPTQLPQLPHTTPVMFTKWTLMIEAGCRSPLRRDPVVNSQVNLFYAPISKFGSSTLNYHEHIYQKNGKFIGDFPLMLGRSALPGEILPMRVTYRNKCMGSSRVNSVNKTGGRHDHDVYWIKRHKHIKDFIQKLSSASGDHVQTLSQASVSLARLAPRRRWSPLAIFSPSLSRPET